MTDSLAAGVCQCFQTALAAHAAFLLIAACLIRFPPCAGIPFVVINSLCGCLVAYGLSGLRLTVHSLLINLVVTALQSMISIQLQVKPIPQLTCSGLLSPNIILSGRTTCMCPEQRPHN